MNATEFFLKIRPSYENFFSINSPYTFDGHEFLASAYFNSRNERYVLVKRAAIWAYEINEHMLFAELPSLTSEALDEYKKLIFKAQDTLVKPHEEHMYTYITLVLLCDKVDRSVLRKVRRLGRVVNYRLSVWGYSCVRIAVVDFETETVTANRRAKDLVSFFGRALKGTGK